MRKFRIFKSFEDIRINICEVFPPQNAVTPRGLDQRSSRLSRARKLMLIRARDSRQHALVQELLGRLGARSARMFRV